MSNQLQAEHFEQQQASLDRMDELREALIPFAGENLHISEAKCFGRNSALIDFFTNDEKPQVVGCIILYGGDHFSGETRFQLDGRVLYTEEDAANFVRALSNPFTQDLILRRPFRNLDNL